MLEAQIDWTFGLHPVLWWFVVTVPTIIIVLLLWGTLMSALEHGFRRPGPEKGRAKRRWGKPIVFEREIPVDEETNLAELAKALAGFGVLRVPGGSADTVLLKGGNEREARIGGMYDFYIFPIPMDVFLHRHNLRSLPTRVELRRGRGGDGQPCVRLRVTDGYRGLLIRERNLEHRYAQATEQMRSLLVRALASERRSRAQ